MFNGLIQSSKLYYNDQTVKGVELVSIDIDPESWVEFDNIDVFKPGLYDELISGENGKGRGK